MIAIFMLQSVIIIANAFTECSKKHPCQLFDRLITFILKIVTWVEISRLVGLANVKPGFIFKSFNYCDVFTEKSQHGCSNNPVIVKFTNFQNRQGLKLRLQRMNNYHAIYSETIKHLCQYDKYIQSIC